jgi:hypothetical protein
VKGAEMTRKRDAEKETIALKVDELAQTLELTKE